MSAMPAGLCEAANAAHSRQVTVLVRIRCEAFRITALLLPLTICIRCMPESGNVYAASMPLHSANVSCAVMRST